MEKEIERTYGLRDFLFLSFQYSYLLAFLALAHSRTRDMGKVKNKIEINKIRNGKSDQIV